MSRSSLPLSRGLFCLWIFSKCVGAFAQGVFDPIVLNTGGGQTLITEERRFGFGAGVMGPALQMKVGFGTDEMFGPGQFFDSFTITLQPEDFAWTLLLATFDASGVVWAPATPGTEPLGAENLVRRAIEYPSLSPVLMLRQAYEVEVQLPEHVVGQPLALYFDLFDNGNALASQGWFFDLVVVPEPGVAALALMGALLLGSMRGRSERDRGPPGRDAARVEGRGWLRGCLLLSCGVWLGSVDRVLAQDERTFELNDVPVTLAEVTAGVDVYFSSMLLNRALNVWNVEVSVSNQWDRVISGPVVLLVAGFSGTSGPQNADGTIESGHGFYDLTGSLSGGNLLPGAVSQRRVLTLGRSGGGQPFLMTQVYAGKSAEAVALALTRSLDEAGRPLPRVRLEIEGPAGAGLQETDRDSGVASFGQGAGRHGVKFSHAGYLPVWREQELRSGHTAVLPNPRLTRRAMAGFAVTPLGGVVVTDQAGSIRVDVPAGAVSRQGTITLTPLTGQTLPAFLPPGWSPLRAFWIESSTALQGGLPAALRPAGPIRTSESAVLARWDEVQRRWWAEQIVGGRVDEPVEVQLSGVGAYALVVADSGDLAPPAALPGQALVGTDVGAIDPGGLTAMGSVTPPSSPASAEPALVTGQGQVELRHDSQRLPSGYLLRGEVTESYLLTDGSLRLTPQYEHFIVGYQRPGDEDPHTLHARFPMRPLLLFGPDQLESATVRVDVLPETPFDGQVLDVDGGQILREGVRLLAADGRLTGPSAMRLRRLDTSVLEDLVTEGYTVAAAFDLTVDGSTVTGPLSAQLSGVPTNSRFVLARVLSDTGFYGLEPVERLDSDGLGGLRSVEPEAGERLPGLRGSGQFVLLRVGQPQGLIVGIARDGAGATREGMPVRLTGLPWLTLTDDQGRFQLVAPAGEVELGVTDPATGDTGFADVTVADPQAAVVQDLAAASAGPRVARITPGHEAARVPRVGSVVIEFNEAVNPATVIGNAIQLLQPDGSVVPAALTLNLRNTTATLIPAIELEANTAYRVRLAATIADPGGLPLEGQSEFTFTTVPLSTRVATAQLIIYEPGATNVPPVILDEIPAFEPGDDPLAIVVHGQPGVADPEVPVILVNESTGETQTVLSKVDGSFSSFISGTEEDFVSATFVNLNGTRVYVPVSRQEFDNGFVGLYPQGGILEAESDGGPVQVYIQPQAIPSRAKIRIKSLSTTELTRLTGGVAPEPASIVGGGMRIEIEGDRPTEPMEISFPVDLAQLGYPEDQLPEEAAVVLAVVRDTQGVTAYEVVDQMVFEPGLPAAGLSLQGEIRPLNDGAITAGVIHTVAGFMPGAIQIAPLFFDFVVVPLVLGAKPVVVNGVTWESAIDTGGTIGGQLGADQFARPLSGTFVILRNTPPIGPPGRLQSGMVYATSGRNGQYLMVAPAANAGYVLTASHPRFQGRHHLPVIPYLDIGFSGLIRKDFTFRELRGVDAPLRLNVSHFPLSPAPEQEAELRVSAFRGLGVPPDILVTVESVTSLVGGESVDFSDVTVTETRVSNNGTTTQWEGVVEATEQVQVVLKITADGVVERYLINFSGVIPPPGDTTLPKPDEHDVHGPVVVWTVPAENETLGLEDEIRVHFNKPIDRYVEGHPEGLLLQGPMGPVKPGVELNADQRTLVLRVVGLEPDSEYTLTMTGQSVRDLAGQPLDQKPGTPELDSFRLRFRSAPVRVSQLSSVMNGRGAVIRGENLYVIDFDQQGNWLRTYDIRNPELPTLIGNQRLIGQPRDLVLIPQYAYQLRLSGPVMTNDLLAVVGGDLDTIFDSVGSGQGNVRARGQFLNVLDLEDPGRPRSLVSATLTFRVGSAVTKVRWSAPHLIYHEFGAEIQQLGVINLQEMLLGFHATAEELTQWPSAEGKDADGDGNYVGPDDELPWPENPPDEFFGKRFAYVLQNTTQKILDFSPMHGGQFIGVTLRHGLRLDPQGQPFGTPFPPAYRTLAISLDLSDPEDSLFTFGNSAFPRWVSMFPALPVAVDGVTSQRSVALVSLQPDEDGLQKLAILDISFPRSPRLLNKVTVEETLLGGAMQSVWLRTDGLLELAGKRHRVLLDPERLGWTNALADRPHPAIVGTIPAAGGGTRTLGATEFGLHATADAGHAALVQIMPELRIVHFPAAPSVVNPQQFPGSEPERQALLETMRSVQAVPPARLRAVDDIASDLNPPRPSAHYHVLLRAPGAAGQRVELALESVDQAGRPFPNLGVGHAPVRALSAQAASEAGLRARQDCDAPIASLSAWRLSDDPMDDFYNVYLSRPFALMANEIVSPAELAELQSQLDREILQSGAGLRAFIDPEESSNRVLGPFAARIDSTTKRVQPVAATSVLSLFHPYIMGDNPPPAGGFIAMPATFGMVAAHSGELRTEAMDMELPSPRMPIVIRRFIGNQDSYDGPFGMGWDFNYNQRINELDPLSFPAGLQMPVVVRASIEESGIADSRDLLFHTGQGRVIHFRQAGETMPPEYVTDPLVAEFGYAASVATYYLPAPRQGVFDLLVKFKDDRYERLTPDGTRYRYAANGRLEIILDRFPANRHVLQYDRGGRLTRIDDRSVTADRYVEFGYHRRADDPDFNDDLDVLTDNPFLEGKIRVLRDFAGGDVLFHYDGEGFLVRRDGIEVAGDNGGFAGRAQTHYVYQDCRFAGMKVGGRGAPLFASDPVPSGAEIKPVAQRGTGVGGSVQLDIPPDNSAARMANQVSTANLADDSVQDIQFDRFGHPVALKSAGDGGAATETQTLFNPEGLIESIRHPEGNAETMSYDLANPVFRSRANLRSRTVSPGARGGEGYTETFNYDPRYNLRSGNQVNANGFVITHVLRADGRETAAVTYGAAGREEFLHNDRGQLLRSEDYRGIETVNVYDSQTGFVQSRNSGNARYDYAYGGDYATLMGRPSVIAPAEGASISMRHDRNLQVVEVGRGDLRERSGYDEQGRRVWRQVDLDDGQQPVTRWEYDDKGFLDRTVTSGIEVRGGAAEVEHRFIPDELSRVRAVVLPQGTTQIHEYDHRGNLTGLSVGDYVEQHELDLNGNRIARKVGGEVVESVEYDGLDRPKVITRRTGGHEERLRLDYFPGGQPRRRILEDDLFGVLEERTYESVDALGRPVVLRFRGTTIEPVFRYEYDRRSVEEIGPRMTIRNTWNAAGYPLSKESANRSQFMTPDANGRILQVERQEDGARYTEWFTYDELGHRESRRDDLGTVATYVARADGHLLEAVNARGHATIRRYSARGDLLSRVRADGMTFRYQYDELALPVLVGDSEGGVTKAYDGTLRLATETRRNGAEARFEDFDAFRHPREVSIPGGSISQIQDWKGRFLERTVEYAGTTHAESLVYDGLDRMREARYRQDGTGENRLQLTYDQAGPLLSAQWIEDGREFSAGFEYRDDRSRRAVRYPSGVVVTEDRDAGGRLRGIADPAGSIIRVTAWQGNEQPATIELGANVIVQNRYDARGRLTATRAVRADDEAVLMHLRFGHDAANNLVTRQFLHRGGLLDAFAYDAGERVEQAWVGARPTAELETATPYYLRTYEYDAAGLDYLTAVSTTPLGVAPPFAASWTDHDAFLLPGRVDGHQRAPADPAGNVSSAELFVRAPQATGPERQPAAFTHDGSGRLVRVLREDGLLVENFFQPDGVRYRRRVTQGGQVLDHRHYVYDGGGRLLEEYDLGSGGPILVARYYYATSDAPDAADLHSFATGDLERYYFLKDAVESVVAVVDERGRTVERTWYDTYGQPVLELADSLPPALAEVVSGENNSLLLTFSEPVSAPFPDPGLGEGVVIPPALDAGTVARVRVGGTELTGAWEFLPDAAGREPRTVFRFTPDGAWPSIPPDILGWWPGDAQVTDVAAGNDGLLRGGAGIAPGLAGEAFDLDGLGAFVEISSASVGNFGTGDFTLTLWVRFEETAGDQVLVEKWDTVSSSGWSLSKTGDGRLRLELAGEGGSSGVAVSAPAIVSRDVWLPVGARRADGNLTVFLGGLPVATGTYAQTVVSSASLRFGSRGGTSAFLNGRLDEIILLGRALSDEEVVSMAGSVSLPGMATVTLNAGVLADEWGNRNAADEISFTPVSSPEVVLYAAQPVPLTAAPRRARSSVGSPFLFQGQYFDYDTGLIYLRARFYDPFSGMFLAPDPLGYEDSVNLYVGFGNNPVSHRDPTGLSILRWLGGKLARGGGRVGDEVLQAAAPVVTKSPLLNTAAEGLPKPWLLERARADVTASATPLIAERVGKFAVEAGSEPVLVLGLKKSIERTAELIGGKTHMASSDFRSAVRGSIDLGENMIVDVSHMSGRTLLQRIENAAAREGANTFRITEGVEGLHAPWATDWEMFNLWEAGLLPKITFVERVGGDIFELANPFARRAAEAAGASAATAPAAAAAQATASEAKYLFPLRALKAGSATSLQVGPRLPDIMIRGGLDRPRDSAELQIP
jgi:RHS repeat-associated protein